jgi:nitrogen fixation protein FixH
MTATAPRPFELKGVHVLAIVVAFFGVVIAVNVGFAVQAYSTFPGEVDAAPFESGVAFNHTLAQRDEERTLGWRAKVATSVGEAGRIELKVTIADMGGAPIRGLALAGKLERPATEAGRLDARFTESKPGVYEASAPGSPGAWDLTITGVDHTGRPFEAVRRLQWR